MRLLSPPEASIPKHLIDRTGATSQPASQPASHQRKIATVSNCFANSPIRRIANPANPADSRIQAVRAKIVFLEVSRKANPANRRNEVASQPSA